MLSVSTVLTDTLDLLAFYSDLNNLTEPKEQHYFSNAIGLKNVRYYSSVLLYITLGEVLCLLRYTHLLTSQGYTKLWDVLLKINSTDQGWTFDLEIRMSQMETFFVPALHIGGVHKSGYKFCILNKTLHIWFKSK